MNDGLIRHSPYDKVRPEMNALVVALGLIFASAPAEGADDAKKYVLDFSRTTQDIKKGGKGTFALKIDVAKGYKVSQEAPLKIKLASSGLSLKKSKLSTKDTTAKKWTSPEFAVAFSAKEPGDQKVEVDAMFFVCDERICERKTERVSVPVSVLP